MDKQPRIQTVRTAQTQYTSVGKTNDCGSKRHRLVFLGACVVRSELFQCNGGY